MTTDGLQALLRAWWAGSFRQATEQGAAADAMDAGLLGAGMLASDVHGRSLTDIELVLARSSQWPAAAIVLAFLEDLPNEPIASEVGLNQPAWEQLREQKRVALLQVMVRVAARRHQDSLTKDIVSHDFAPSEVTDSSDGDGRVAVVTSDAFSAQSGAGEGGDGAEILERWGRYYRRLPAESQQRVWVLAWLAWGDAASLQRWAEWIIEDPPKVGDGIKDFFAPLLQRDESPSKVIFPTLLSAVSELDLATAVLDLANYYFRERGVRPHPASSRVEPLSRLLAQVTQQLLQIETDPLSAGIPVERLSQVINDTVGLISALSDFLALHGDAVVVGKLYPCLEVRHRRVQLEAAYALAALGEEPGRERLVELADEPLVRRRVIAYAKQLNLLDKIPESCRSSAALAESELVLSLAHPQSMGLAPKSTMLRDSRTMYWPSFDEPVECFLFDYEYPFPEVTLRGVGIVGPVTHYFSATITELNNEELYALFAGWHVTHPEIFTVDQPDFGPQQAGTIARLQRRLSDQGLEDLQPMRLGCCLGQWVLIARATKGGQAGWGIGATDEPVWLPDQAGFVHLDSMMVWYFWLGRTLLNQFNAEPN